ncbi:type IV pilin protein [Arhodomonas aquaeolei]|uniref:type IV pilin protein n=1 Tax=Arhodomonas aquaeolei TaxID=2369 RepID=UPI00037E8723|nr:type IV pilin protein [Arhodomonas aquaeolei]
MIIRVTRERSVAGFTLIELMIVVAVLAIIAAIAYPTYQGQVQASRRADGKSMLMQVMHAEERYYTENYSYTTDLDDSGDGGELGLNDGGASAGNVLSDDEFYEISASGCGSGIGECVQLTASRRGAQQADTECGNLTMDSLGNRGNTGSAPADECW